MLSVKGWEGFGRGAELPEAPVRPPRLGRSQDGGSSPPTRGDVDSSNPLCVNLVLGQLSMVQFGLVGR